MTDSVKNEVFTDLLREFAQRLGVDFSMSDDEQLSIEFEDDVFAAISHRAEREQMVVEACTPLPPTLTDDQALRIANLLLLTNSQLMQAHSISIAFDTAGRILLLSVLPQRHVDAMQLADTFEEVVEQARWVRSVCDQLVAADAGNTSNSSQSDSSVILG